MATQSSTSHIRPGINTRANNGAPLGLLCLNQKIPRERDLCFFILPAVSIFNLQFYILNLFSPSSVRRTATTGPTSPIYCPNDRKGRISRGRRPYGLILEGYSCILKDPFCRHSSRYHGSWQAGAGAGAGACEVEILVFRML